MTHQNQEMPQLLKIAVRRTIRADQPSVVSMLVFCPSHAHLVDVEQCRSCASCEGLSIDASTDTAVLTCRGPSASLPPRGVAADSVPISQVMTRGVLCVDPALDVEAVTALLLTHNISGAPVVDDKGHPIGIVSKTDVLRDSREVGDSAEVERVMLSRQGCSVDLGPGYHVEESVSRRVRDIMMPLPFALPESASVARAAALMALEGVHRVVVVAPDNAAVGVLSSLDVLRWLARTNGYVLHGAQIAEPAV